MVHNYSKLSLIVGLKGIGKWDAAKSWIKAAGLEDEWLAAQWLSSNYDGFDAMITKFCEDCDISRPVMDGILNEAERAWMR